MTPKPKLGVEIAAGITTFLTMAYIIFVNSDILSATGMDKTGLIAATCIAAAFASLLTGLVAKSPIAMAPGMGLNAFFAYSIVLGDKIEWQTALGIVFISGLFFLLITLVGLRKKIVEATPVSLVYAISVGIGLFIAFIGLVNMGLVVNSDATLVEIGTFTPQVLIGLTALLLIIVLDIYNIKGAILFGIAFATISGIVIGEVTLPETAFSLDFNLNEVAFKLNIIDALQFSFIGAIFSLMFTDMFDSIGTIIACKSETNEIDKNGKIIGLDKILSVDALATMAGALFGTSTTTAYVESTTGIRQGGRTGVVSLTVAVLFLLALPIIPLIAIVPSYATAPALIFVGLYMVKNISKINLESIETAFPAFVTIIMIPFTYSISTGIALGFLSYILVNVIKGQFKNIKPTLWVIGVLCVLFFV
jgi:AGZA family xanthine/uracil permease-like MFS transporter